MFSLPEPRLLVVGLLSLFPQRSSRRQKKFEKNLLYATYSGPDRGQCQAVSSKRRQPYFPQGLVETKNKAKRRVEGVVRQGHGNTEHMGTQ